MRWVCLAVLLFPVIVVADRGAVTGNIGPPVIATDPACQWDPVSLGDGNGAAQLVDSSCFDLVTASYINFTSRQCQSVAMTRIIGTWRGCNQAVNPTEVCVARWVRGDVIAFATPDGIHRSPMIGPTIEYIEFDQVQTCGGTYFWNMTTSCECREPEWEIEIIEHGDPPIAHILISEEWVVVCSDTQVNGQVIARADLECDAMLPSGQGGPGPDIWIEVNGNP